jgi:hypothetical protein
MMTRILLFTALAATFLSAAAKAEPTNATEVCHPLVVEAECHDYHTHLHEARTVEERIAVQRKYDNLVRERLRSCPCDKAPKWDQQIPASAPNRIPAGRHLLI